MNMKKLNCQLVNFPFSSRLQSETKGKQKILPETCQRAKEK